MSMEAAKAFLNRIKIDRDFAKEVSACKDAEARMAFVNKAGFDCTGAEIKLVSSELTEEEQEHISAGWGCSMDTCSTSYPNDPGCQQHWGG